jgi:hypothetical protein
MRVRYLGLPPDQGSDWFVVGTIYTVLTIQFIRGKFHYRLLAADSNMPAYHLASQFQAMTRYIPSSWKIEMNPQSDIFTLAPEAWLVNGFWEKYFDGDPGAREIFETELRRMVAEEDNL